MSYWDAAYIAKFYLDEPQSDRIRALAEAEGDVSCSRFGYLETVSAFHRKFREGAIREADHRELCDQLEADTEAGLWAWLPVSVEALDEAAAAFRRLPKGVVLRSGDALHLATAKVNRVARLYSSDARLLAAARHFQVSASDPAGP